MTCLRIILLLVLSMAAVAQVPISTAAGRLASIGAIVADLLNMQVEDYPDGYGELRVEAFVATNLTPDASETVVLLWETSGADWVTLEHSWSFLIGVPGWGVLARELPPDGMLTVGLGVPFKRQYRIRAHNNIQQGAPTAVSEPITIVWE